MRAADEFSTKSHSPPPRRLHIPLTPDASVPGSIDALLTTALRAEQKASRRAEVRHRRLRKTQSNDGGAPTAQAVLVIEPDDTARDQLCDLLRAFGFAVHAVADPAEASALATSRFFAAIFVDIDAAPPGGDGIDLCKHVREVRQSSDTYASILVLVAARLQPTDRVRAALAGCDETILKPMSRGVVARMLDVRGISLPSDERRV
jgi:CheY-like chemotaxis protein